MRTFKLTLAYDGAGLVGWQRQANGTSIQGLLEDALGLLEGRHVDVAGAGRTDAGVHALGQVASVRLEREISAEGLLRALNAHLPPSVRVVRAEVAADAFHARFDARAKTYRYRIWTGDVLSPFARGFAWHVPVPLDRAAMDEAARRLEGWHDFAAFQTIGTETATTRRRVLSSRVASAGDAEGLDPDALVVYEVTGEGFLRHMVRAIAGTLVDVGRGRHPASWVDDVLASRDRGQAGRTAPAEGLFLVRVDYAPDDDPDVPAR